MSRTAKWLVGCMFAAALNLVSVATASAQGSPYPGFEQVDFTGWSVTFIEGDPFWLSVTPSSVCSQNGFGLETDILLEQDVYVPADGDVTLAADVSAEFDGSRGGSWYFGVLFDDRYLSAASLGSYTYDFQSATLTATATLERGWHRFSFEIYSPPGGIGERSLGCVGNARIALPKTDTTPPATSASTSGPLGQNGWYTGPVHVTLAATDPDGPADVAATSYTLDGSSQQSYAAPFTVSGDGTHTLTFFSVDQAGNQEAPNSLTLKIDATPPSATAAANPAVLWPPSGKRVPVVVSGKITDALSRVDRASATYAVVDDYGLVQPQGTLPVGPDGSYSVTLMLEASRRGRDRTGRHYRITVTGSDLAGNTGQAVAVVRVPHDQR